MRERMGTKEVEDIFLPRLRECVLSLPFDLKVLQEAASDPDLDRVAREEIGRAHV